MNELLQLLLFENCNKTSDWLLENSGNWYWLGENWCSIVNTGVPTGILASTYFCIVRLLKYHRQRKLAEDLHPYYSRLFIKQAKRFYIRTRFQDQIPSLEDIFRNKSRNLQKPLIQKMLDQVFEGEDEKRFHMVLGGSGMGKTTFMINLCIKYVRKIKLWKRKYEIFLLPLGAEDIEEKINKIEDKESTILLLDSLEEDQEAEDDYEARLDRLILGDRDSFSGVKDFRRVVFTCRTQFFTSESKEPNKTKLRIHSGDGGFHVFYKYYITPFSIKDIRTYLWKKFRFKFNKLSFAYAIIGKAPDLMVRPMLLSRIEDFADRIQVNSLKDYWKFYKYYFLNPRLNNKKLINPIDKLQGAPEELKGESFLLGDIYKLLINKWLKREIGRVDTDNPEFFERGLKEFIMALAWEMYKNQEEGHGLLQISWAGIKSYYQKYNIGLFDKNNVLFKARSLLSRDEKGNYQFAHKSIWEYFLAELYSTELEFRRTFSFQGMDFVKNILMEPGSYLSPKMVHVRGGRFVLSGSVECILDSFEIGKYPVSQSLWEAVMGENPSEFLGCPDCPVENVSWDDANYFIEKLNKFTGNKFRLPTEAEWEYAALGGTDRLGYKFMEIDDLNEKREALAEESWFSDNSNSRTHPVGQKSPNGLEIFDMAGNVWEWCSDWWQDSLQEEARENPSGPEGGIYRVIRGGSWKTNPDSLSIKYRVPQLSNYKNETTGLRLARSF